MFTHTLFVVLMQYQVSDPARTAQMAELALKARVQEHAEERRRRTNEERLRFEARFNALVKAVETFGKRYNEGRGHVWPKREADALRKALDEFQDIPAFRPNEKQAKR